MKLRRIFDPASMPTWWWWTSGVLAAIAVIAAAVALCVWVGP